MLLWMPLIRPTSGIEARIYIGTLDDIFCGDSIRVVCYVNDHISTLLNNECYCNLISLNKLMKIYLCDHVNELMIL